MQKLVLIIASTLALAACATPHVSVVAATPGGAGGIPAALAQMSLELEETRSAEGGGDSDGSETGSVTYTLTGTIEDSPRQFLLIPEQSQWAETALAPTYYDNTSVLKTLAIETVDRRLEFFQALVSIATTFGADLSTFDAANLSCAVRLDAEAVIALMPAGRGAGAREFVYPADEELQKAPECELRLAFGAVPADAIAVVGEEGRAPFDPSSIAADEIPYTACRRLVAFIQNKAVSPGEGEYLDDLWVPDPRYVRLTRLPHQGTLSFAQLCSPPDHTELEQAAKSDITVLSEILALFRDEDEKAGD